MMEQLRTRSDYPIDDFNQGADVWLKVMEETPNWDTRDWAEKHPHLWANTLFRNWYGLDYDPGTRH